MTWRSGSLAVAIAVTLLLAACASRAPAPVSERTPLTTYVGPPPPPLASVEAPREREATPPPTYTVKRGDTLAQIALDNGLDYRDLATWNNIENPNVIRVGQVLVIAAPGQPSAAAAGAGGAVTTPLAAAPPIAPKSADGAPATTGPVLPSSKGNTATLKTEPKALKLPYSEQALAQLQAPAPAGHAAPAIPPPVPPSVAAPAAPVAPTAVAAAPAATPGTAPARPDGARVPEIDDDKIMWVWPTAGKLIAGFSDTASLKGIDIAGKAGQPVVASAAGKVVYSGSGLRGYGKLIIVKHNTTFLSAYAHNREILVKEGQQVVKGQKISEMGDTDADQVKLHFEIRRLGKPVDPVKYLPPA
ncbi:MAG: peptidoglycan DD-metalloendopeptidase family protein [Casimicrobiaceae bacterium]